MCVCVCVYVFVVCINKFIIMISYLARIYILYIYIVCFFVFF